MEWPAAPPHAAVERPTSPAVPVGYARGMLQRIIGVLLRASTRRRARGRDVGSAAEALEASRPRVAKTIATARDTARHRDVAAHVVGIERWGQSRLRVALGAPFTADGHHPYRPPVDGGLEALRAAFEATRADTVALARELAEADVDPARTVRHDHLGELTVVEWLVYLDDHARRDSLGLRGRRD